MNNAPRPTISLCLAVAAGFLCSSLECRGATQPRFQEWYQVENEATRILCVEKRKVVTVTQEFARQVPSNRDQAFLKLNVLMRAGLEREACTALDLLRVFGADFNTDQGDSNALNDIYTAAVFTFHEAEFARHFAETYPGAIRDSLLSVANLLLESGWSLEAVDAWLLALPADKSGIRIKDRLSMQVRHCGHPEKLLQPMIDAVRAQLDDIPAATKFLDAVLAAQSEPGKIDMTWLAKVCRPKTTTEAYQLATRLRSSPERAGAAKLYRLALAIPLTDKDFSGPDRFPLPVVLPHETYDISEVLVQLVRFALEAGDKPGALRLWKTLANANPCHLSCLDEFARAGLRMQLQEYYRDFTAKLPSSVIPARALQILESKFQAQARRATRSQ